MSDNITIAVTNGKHVRASWFTQMQRALSALKLDELQKPISAPEIEPPNRYARCGIAARLRAERRSLMPHADAAQGSPG